MINYIEELKADFHVMKNLPNNELKTYIKNRYKVFALSIWYALKKFILVFVVLTIFIFVIHFIINNIG